ncbi:MAG TPA: type II toxin-antitoxin system RelE/ParE family toxin [Longimicrobium sp.]|nr:type II toxin-antitoxin system RelE/ParE family toxin [Longimicrobium sp.]
MIFKEFGSFTAHLTEYMDDDEYRLLQNALLVNPLAGVVIPGTGGVRKLRWAGSGRGKRGGLRIIYYLATGRSAFLMIFIYAKGDQADLRQEQKHALRALMASER